MKFTRFAPIVLAATLLVGCAATPPAAESESPSLAATSAPVTTGITSSSKVHTLDEALTFAATLSPDMSSAKYEVVNTASKLIEYSADEISPEAYAEVVPELETIVTDATGSTTRDELVTQIEALEAVVATIESARA